jgi:hypothetical protein
MIHVLDEAGEFYEETRLPTTAAALKMKFGNQPPVLATFYIQDEKREC